MPEKNNKRERQSALPTTTAPLPERQRYNPIRRSDRYTVRVNSLHAPAQTTKTIRSEVPHGPPVGTAERSVLPSQMRTGTTK
jgi:hypothetical protein